MNAVGFFTGLAFGFVIVAARLNEDTVIRDMLLRRDPEPYLVLGSGVLMAAPLLRWLRARRWLAPVAREVVAFQPQPIRRDHIFGGVVFGTGWAIACTCPVPAVGMVATGNLLGLPVVAGLLAGVLLREAQLRRNVTVRLPTAEASPA